MAAEVVSGAVVCDDVGHPTDDEIREMYDGNVVLCKEDMDYEDLCTLESLLSYFEHDISLDMEIANLKEDCLNHIIADLKERASELITIMFYVKSNKVPEDMVDDLLSEAMENPMPLFNYINEDDMGKLKLDIDKYLTGGR